MRRLDKELREKKILDRAQAAFQAHKSSTDQAAFLTQKIQDGFNMKKSTLAVFVDFKSAYDLISRSILIKKMNKIGISTGIIWAIRDFLCQRFISIRCFDRSSEFKQTKRGLPQGSVSSTTLFNIMINDLCSILRQIPGVDVILYADDLVILVSGDSMMNIQTTMNRALDALKVWTEENEMVINTEKTKFQTFSMRNNIQVPSLKIGTYDLQESTAQTYLGIKLDRRLTFKLHAKQQSEKAENRLKILKRLTASTWGASLHTLVTTYKSYILPVLNFGDEMMICASDSVNKHLDLVQNKALRIITGGIKTTPIAAMEILTGIKPLQFSRKESAMKMFERIIRVPNHIFNNYKPAVNSLASKVSFVDKVLQTYGKFDLQAPNAVRRFTTSKKSRMYHRQFTKKKSEISKKMKTKIIAHHETESQGKIWSTSSLIALRSLKRNVLVANFRKSTGHDILNCHLARIGVKNSAICSLCQKEEQTSNHLLTCSELAHLRIIQRNLNSSPEEMFSALYWHVRSIQ